MAEQKALYLESQDGPFIVKTRSIPSPAKGELLVKVHATGLNPVDCKLWVRGLLLGGTFPAILGSDIAGEVYSTGEGIEGFSKGDRILSQGFYRPDYASFQQYTLVPADIAAKIPKNVSYEQAATVPVALSAAAMALWAEAPNGAGLKPSFDLSPHYEGNAALILGGSTSSGQYAIQLFRLSGFIKIIAYASARHADFLKSLGATDIIDRNVTELSKLSAIVRDIADNLPLPVVFDAVGDADLQQAGYDSLSPNGQFVTILPDNVEDKSEGKTVIKVLASSHFPPHRSFGQELYKHLESLLSSGALVPNRFEVLPNGLQGIATGLGRLRNNQVSGAKLVGHPQET